METRIGSRQHGQRMRTVSGGKRKRGVVTRPREVLPDIACQYGVMVQRTLIPGMELIEFEFRPDVA